MINLLLAALIILLFVCVGLVLVIYRNKKHYLRDVHRGSLMTVAYDAALNITDIINPCFDILPGNNKLSLIGHNVREFCDLDINGDKDAVKIIADNIIEASNKKTDLFFEYTMNSAISDNLQQNSVSHIMYYVEYMSDGGLLCHVFDLDVVKRISGCAKCSNYVVALGINNLSVGVYIRQIGQGGGKYVYYNDLAKSLCGYVDSKKAESWNQQEEDKIDFSIVDYNSPLSYEKVLYGQNGKPESWFSVLKVKQSIGKRGDYIITTLTDISELKKREIELEEVKFNLGLVIGYGDMSVWRYNLSDRCFRALYGELYAPTGSTLEEVADIMHDDSKQDFYRVIDNLLTKKTKSEEIVFCIFDSIINDYRHVKSDMITVLSSDGEVDYVIGTHKDITDTRHKEIELQGMRNSLDMAINTGNIVAWEYDIIRNKYRILYGSDNFDSRVFSEELWKVDDFGKNIVEEDFVKYIEFTKRLIAKGGKDSTIIRFSDDDNYEYYEMAVSVINGESGVPEKLLGTQKNVTNLHRQKVELEKVRENLSLAMEAGCISAWMYDIKKEVFFTLHGDAVAGKGSTMKDNLKLLHPDDWNTCINALKSIANGLTERENIMFRLKAHDVDGGYRFFESKMIAVKRDGAVARITGTQKDVTEAHFQQQKAKESNDKVNKVMAELQQVYYYNRLILDNTNFGLVYITSDFVVRWENVSSRKGLMGKYLNIYKEGTVCYKYAKGLDSPCLNCIMQKAILSRQQESEEVFLDRDSVIDVSAIPVIGKNHEVDGVVLCCDDVTQQKKSYNELQEAKERAERSDKLKSAFIANMSHEIRTPLNAIVGFSELMIDATSVEERNEYNNVISVNNKLLLKLINDILDLSKIEAGYVNIKNEYFDISELYNELMATFLQNMVPGVKFICDNLYPGLIICLDKSRLTQVITNFVTNAIKFTSEGYIKIGYKYTKDGIMIYVSDTGIGIPLETCNTIFERFEKLNGYVQGTGLGLSICKSIVSANNGTIGVDSKLGEGSTFWAKFPCEVIFTTQNIGDGSHDMLIDEDICEADEDLKKMILIAEDTDSNYILVNKILEQDYNLTRVGNGEQAVKEVFNNRYDIVLMDIKMPVMNGIEATRKIREFNKDIPIVAITANAFDSDKKQALDAGCNEFITKPINKKVLLKVVDDILKGSYNK